MNAEQLSEVSNYSVASATVILALAFAAYAAQWGFARKVPIGQLASVSQSKAAASGWGDTLLVDRDKLQTSETAGAIGFSLTVLAELVLIVGVVTRGLAANRVPWGNMYEFSAVGIAAVLAAYIGLVKVWNIDWAGLLTTLFSVIVLGSSMLFLYVPAAPLVPALDSYWLVIHVAGAIISGAAFAVGAIASVLYLVRSRAEQKTPAGERTGLIWRMPSAQVIDQVSYRLHAFAFPIWTFAALIAGPIWAQAAWGRYWGWDAKEVWAFITWVVYAAYLHARATTGVKGKGAAILALIGFATFMFNYVGVNLFVGGLHSYAK